MICFSVGKEIFISYNSYVHVHMMLMADLNVPNDPTERREWIKFQLRIRGSSLSAVAREMGVSRHATNLALAKPYPRMERAIAAKIGIPPCQLWPERYAGKAR